MKNKTIKELQEGCGKDIFTEGCLVPDKCDKITKCDKCKEKELLK